MIHYEKTFDVNDYRSFTKETTNKEKFYKLVKEITSLTYIVVDKVELLQKLVEEDNSFTNEDLQNTLNILTMFSVETVMFSEDLEDNISSN